MSAAAHPSSDPRVRAVEITDELITAHLIDGRTISVPLAWSWRLSDATRAQRAHYGLSGMVPVCIGQTSMRTSACTAC